MKITTKHASTGNSHFTFVTQKHFAILLFLPSCCVNSLFLDDNETNDNGYGKENGKKHTAVNKTITSHVHHSFCTFLSCGYCCGCKSATSLRLETSVFHASALWSSWTQHKKNFFLFRNSDTDLSDSTPDNFAKSLQINWNWVRLMKFETVQIHFLVTLPWQSDITSLCYASSLNIQTFFV